MKSKSGINTSELVYQHLKNKILNRELRSGDKIQEQKLGEELGVSRTPIREALQKMASEGLVSIDRNAEVCAYSGDQIRQIGEMRMSLELMSAKLALYYGSDADFHRMDRLAGQCAKAAREGDVARHISLDSAFHLFLTECSRNPILLDMQRKLYARVELIRANSPQLEQEGDALVSYHHRLVEQLRLRDQDAVVRSILEHFYTFYELRKYYPPDFFDLFQQPKEMAP